MLPTQLELSWKLKRFKSDLICRLLWLIRCIPSKLGITVKSSIIPCPVYFNNASFRVHCTKNSCLLFSGYASMNWISSFEKQASRRSWNSKLVFISSISIPVSHKPIEIKIYLSAYDRLYFIGVSDMIFGLFD